MHTVDTYLEYGSNSVLAVIYCYLFSLPTALTPFPGLHTTYVHVCGVSTVYIATSGVEKKGFTVALCISTSGKKLPAFLISKEQGGKLGPRVMIEGSDISRQHPSFSIHKWLDDESQVKQVATDSVEGL